MLFNKLQVRVAEFEDDSLFPIVYLDSKFSCFLNIQGLYQLALRLRTKTQPKKLKVFGKEDTGFTEKGMQVQVHALFRIILCKYINESGEMGGL